MVLLVDNAKHADTVCATRTSVKMVSLSLDFVVN